MTVMDDVIPAVQCICFVKENGSIGYPLIQSTVNVKEFDISSQKKCQIL